MVWLRERNAARRRQAPEPVPFRSSRSFGVSGAAFDFPGAGKPPGGSPAEKLPKGRGRLRGHPHSVRLLLHPMQEIRIKARRTLRVFDADEVPVELPAK